jgi:hypothetical protein
MERLSKELGSLLCVMPDSVSRIVSVVGAHRRIKSYEMYEWRSFPSLFILTS